MSLTYTPDPRLRAARHWSPVKRRARHDGWTAEKQRRFIHALGETGHVALAAQAADMTRESAYRLRRAAGAEGFASAWDFARDRACARRDAVDFPEFRARTRDTLVEPLRDFSPRDWWMNFDDNFAAARAPGTTPRQQNARPAFPRASRPLHGAVNQPARSHPLSDRR